jgi:hypothetical protein
VPNEASLDSLALTAAMEYGIRNTGISIPLVCATIDRSDPSPELLASVQVGRQVALRPGSACLIDTTGGPLTGRSLVRERSSTLRGISINTDQRIVAPDGSVSFMISYYQNYLSSADWRCTARHQQNRWVLDVCRLERIS